MLSSQTLLLPLSQGTVYEGRKEVRLKMLKVAWTQNMQKTTNKKTKRFLNSLQIFLFLDPLLSLSPTFLHFLLFSGYASLMQTAIAAICSWLHQLGHIENTWFYKTFQYPALTKVLLDFPWCSHIKPKEFPAFWSVMSFYIFITLWKKKLPCYSRKTTILV